MGSASQEASLVIFEPAEGFSWIRFNRPEKRNAMNQAARDALRDAMANAQAHAPVVLLTGSGGSFCGGIDLKEVQAQAKEGSTQALEDWRDVNLQIRAHPAVFVAVVNGVALGGGTTLTGICDLAIAGETASFGMPEIGFGMYANPAGPATQLAQLSRKRAAWLLLTANRIDARTALAWGLINDVSPDAALEGDAASLGTHLAQFDGRVLTECKRALDAIPQTDWRGAFEYGAGANARINDNTEAALEGLTRFSRGERNPGQGVR
ncbi:MAG: enoyl-CoA hydratase/isomerase family protein [Pseudomonadota bacterium]